MVEEAWSRFLEYTARARTKPTFDAEERHWKLELARTVRSALAAAGSNGDWLDELLTALKRPSPPFLTSNGQRRWLRAWDAAERESLRRGLAAFADPGLDPVERLRRFGSAAEGFEPDRRLWRMAPDELRRTSVLTFGALLNFSIAPESVPITRPLVSRRLRRLLGLPGGAEGDSAVAQYRGQLELADDVRARLERHGVPIRDMIDVQSLISIGVQEASLWTADPPDDWGPRAGRPLPPGAAYVAVCAVYRDEAADLREWIEFHRLVGVERFFLYDNLSRDGHLEVLAPYLERGIVIRHEWPASPPVQAEIYDDCLERHREDARWIAFTDVDEFLFSPTGRPLGELLPAYEPWPGIAVNLASFSYCGHRTRPSGLVIENYPLRDTAETGLLKQIVDPLRTVRCESPHWYVYEYGLPVDENRWPVATGWTKSTSFERLRINHYGSKSEREAREKMEREPGWKHLARWRRSDLQGELELVRDDAITRWAPAVRATLAQPVSG